MNLSTYFLTKNDCFLKNIQLKPKGVMVHSTGANNPNIKRYVPISKDASSLHWNRSGLTKCVHAFVGYMPNGEIGSVQTLPWTMKGWHAGSPAKGKVGANNTHIGFEVCEDGLTDEVYFKKVYKEACELVAYLCNMFHLDPLEDGVVISHHEGHLRGVASNHADIDHWLKLQGMTMKNLRNDVVKIMHKEDDTMDDKLFAEYMERYLATRKTLTASDWAIREGFFQSELGKQLTDGTAPQAFATREEVMAMVTRAAAIAEKEINKPTAGL